MGNKNTILAFALLFSVPVLSQSVDAGRNMGKVNLSAFAMKGFNLQYERQVSDRMTIALGYAKIPTSSIAFTSFIENQINDSNVKLADFKLGTSVFTPEIRYYFGREGAFHGFYLAPYARAGKYTLSGPVEFSTNAHTRNVVFDGSLQAITGGLMAGSSFRLSDNLYLDWWIAGAGIGGASGSFKAITPLAGDEQESLKQVLDDLKVPLATSKYEVNSSGATVSTTGTTVGIRGFGINLGMRF